MKITVTGSLGNISRPLVEKLTANGHEVKVISSNAEKADDIKKLGAVPLIGSLADAAFVSRSFKGADAVYTMVPPDFSVPSYYDFSDQLHENYAQAIAQNNIQYVVNLSSIGVALSGKAPLEKFYNLEKKLNDIKGVNIAHLRPGMFYTNFYGNLALAKHQGIVGHNVAGTIDLLMTHPADIAEAAFALLNTLSFTGQQTRYVISDRKNGNEVAAILGEAIRKPLQWVEFPDTVLLEGLLQNGFTRDAAETLIIATGKAIREGLFDVFGEDQYRVKEGRKFSVFAKEFEQAYAFSN